VNRLPASDCHFETFKSFKSFLAAQTVLALIYLLFLNSNFKFAICYLYFVLIFALLAPVSAFSFGAVGKYIMCIVVNKQTNNKLVNSIRTQQAQLSQLVGCLLRLCAK